MSCTGNQNNAVDAPLPSRAFDTAFAQFWPAHQPFPPATPWLAAAVSRAQARQWAIEVGADRDPGVLAGDMQAMLHVVGLAMAGGGAYEAVREKKKKKDKRPELPDDIGDTVPENDCVARSCSCPFPGGGNCCQVVCLDGTVGDCVECALA